MDITKSRRRIGMVVKKIKATPANDTVKVQWTQNNQHVNKLSNKSQPEICSSTQQRLMVEEEVENVEYLDEEEYAAAVTAQVDEQTVGPAAATEAVDTFYSNAIECLLSLYRIKYQQQPRVTCSGDNIWEEIARDMRSSYFEFDHEQVKRKFCQLRRQYFSISNQQEAEEFPYFQQLHSIYQDKGIAALAAGESGKAAEVYWDEVLLQPNEASNVEGEIRGAENQDAEAPEYQMEESLRHDVIAHRNNESIDMAEKELQAQIPQLHHEESEFISEEMNLQSSPQPPAFIKRELSDIEQEHAVEKKRLKLGATITAQRTPANSSPPLQQQTVLPPIADPTITKEGFTLATYNTHQERRHQEKMELFRQNLELQLRAIEIQKQLIKELINRS